MTPAFRDGRTDRPVPEDRLDLQSRVPVTEFSLPTEAEALQAALEIARTGAWGCDEQTQTKLWPPQTKAIFGLPPEVEMTRDLFVSLLHPDDVPVYRKAWAAAVDPDGTHIYQAVYRIRRANDGEERWINSRARVTFSNRVLSRVFGAMRDVTEDRVVLERLRLAEQELRSLNAGLEERVRQEIQARHAAQAALVRAENLAALGRLAGGIAHDFNNMLQIILGAAAVAGRRADDAETVARFAAMIETTAQRGAAVTGRLLSFARQAELRAEAFDLAPLLHGLADVMRHTMGDGIAIRLQIEADLPPALADRSQLETVLINLAANAHDAMGGFGQITLSAALDQITAADHSAGLAPGRYLRITVTDTGHGMDEETLSHAMEPFFTTKQRGKGTGLGLSMARGFAQQSGGGLAITSAPGRGTAVQLWISPANTAVREHEAEEPPAAPTARRATVLLVDDESAVLDVLAAQLDSHGFTVLPAQNADTALERLRAGAPVDMLVSDYSMPGMNGLGLIEEAQALRPGLPAVLLTGYLDNCDLITVKGPSVRLLTKPIAGADLVRCITAMTAAAMELERLGAAMAR